MQGTLARRLRVLRAERGLTLRDAERVTSVDKDTLSKLERGVRHPQDVTLAKIAKGYGVPVEELLEEPVFSGKAGPKLARASHVEVRVSPQKAGSWLEPDDADQLSRKLDEHGCGLLAMGADRFEEYLAERPDPEGVDAAIEALGDEWMRVRDDEALSHLRVLANNRASTHLSAAGDRLKELRAALHEAERKAEALEESLSLAA